MRFYWGFCVREARLPLHRRRPRRRRVQRWAKIAPAESVGGSPIHPDQHLATWTSEPQHLLAYPEGTRRSLQAVIPGEIDNDRDRRVDGKRRAPQRRLGVRERTMAEKAFRQAK
jgi:hypothetical protein